MSIRIKRSSQAGTLQSSDLMVSVEPSQELIVDIDSTVEKQFGHLIRAKVDDVLRRLGVSEGRITVSDRGALNYAIEARVETAVSRATDQ